MPIYRVEAKLVAYVEIDIEAESEVEAEELFQDMGTDELLNQASDVDFEYVMISEEEDDKDRS